MRCDEFQDQLNAVLDERRSPLSDEGLVRHAKTCMSCDASLAMSVQLVGAFAAEFVSAVDGAKTVDRKTVDRVAQAALNNFSLQANAKPVRRRGNGCDRFQRWAIP